MGEGKLTSRADRAVGRPGGGLYARCVAGGTLMGLANLVPGISGGTMLLAAGIYRPFIESIAEVTRLRFRPRALGVLAGVGLAAIAAIALLAGTVKDLVVDHRWLMYSLFIGLTLGGVPVVWKLIRDERRRATGATEWSLGLATVAGVVGMGALAWMQAAGSSGQTEHSGFLFMLLAGTVAAAAMILPGVSGGYLFLVLGVYVAVLAGIESFVEALKVADFAALVPPTLQVVLPIGLGMLLGMVVVSNALTHAIVRGPDKWPTEENMALDHRFIDMITAANVDEAIDWLPEYARTAKCEMGGRGLGVFLGAAEALQERSAKLTGKQYGPYAQSSASGNANLMLRAA